MRGIIARARLRCPQRNIVTPWPSLVPTRCSGCSRPAARSTPTGCSPIGGCRADALAAEFGTPVLVVSRAGAARAGARVRRRARRALAALARGVRLQGVPVHRRPARDGRGGARARRRRRRRDRHRARGGRGPGAARPARQRQERRRDRDGRRARASASSSSTTATTSTGSRRPCRRASTGRARARHPRRHRRHPRARADRPRGLEVRAGAGRRRRADPADRAQPAAAHAGAARPRRLADPRRRAVRAVGGAGRRARRVPRLRPRRRARRALHLRRRPPARRRLSRRAGRRRARAPARRGGADHRARPQHGRLRGATLYRVVTVKRGAITSSPSTAGWATTSRWRCSASASRPASPTALDAGRRRDGDRRRPPLRERRRARRRRRGSRRRASATCSPSRPPARTASRWPTTTTAPAGIPVVFAADGAARLVVRRETWADLLARDVE